ncbi:MAG: type II toxin-antitoxin system Phd/YefM family antitoxin [Candidatus Dormibacteraceae bacterium]
MPEIGMHDAKTTLSRLVDRAEHGEEIVITSNGTPVARLTPIPKPNRIASIYGVLRGQSILPDEVDVLPDDVAEAFGIV